MLLRNRQNLPSLLSIIFYKYKITYIQHNLPPILSIIYHIQIITYIQPFIDHLAPNSVWGQARNSIWGLSGPKLHLGPVRPETQFGARPQTHFGAWPQNQFGTGILLVILPPGGCSIFSRCIY